MVTGPGRQGMNYQCYLICLRRLLRTQAVYWIIPARLTIGFALLWPLNGSAPYFDAYCHAIFTPLVADAGCHSLRFLEVLSGCVIIFGLVTRPACFVAVSFFLARVAGNVYASWFSSESLLPPSSGFRDNWIDGVAYLAGVAIILDLLAVGGGKWSLDRWISQRLEVPSTGNS